MINDLVQSRLCYAVTDQKDEFGDPSRVLALPDEADLISSKVSGGWHQPVLDIDYGAQLVPSSTEGHFHLYLNQIVPWDKYVAALEAMADAGMIQKGFAEASIRRGATFVRHPDKPKRLEKPDHPLYRSDSAETFGAGDLFDVEAA